MPARCSLWSDIWLDFEGFSAAAGVTALIIVIQWLIRFIIRRVKLKKQATMISDAPAQEENKQEEVPKQEESPDQEEVSAEEPKEEIKEKTDE